MPPRKNAAAPSATGTAKLSAADFFKPAKSSTSLRTTPFKNLNQKSQHTVIVQSAVDRQSHSDLTAVTSDTKKRPAPDTDKEDGFGDDLDLNGVLSDDDFFFSDLKDHILKDSTLKDSIPKDGILKNSTLKNKSPKCIGKTGLQTGTRQEDASEMLLRQFDLTSKYGPCLGLTRLERWERASLLDLNPPKEIKNLLDKTMNLNTPLFATHV